MAGRVWQVENSVKLIILFGMLIVAPIRADPETRLLAYGCSSVPNSNVTLFAENLKAALDYVVQNVVPSGFASKDVGASDLDDSVYVLAQCRKDKSAADCADCIKVATKQASNCTSVTGGRASYDGCLVRFENDNFYNDYTDDGNKQVCGDANVSSANSFSATARSLISDLCAATPRIKDYFAAQTRQGPSNTTIYGLASCIRSLQMDSCQKCLAIALDNINKCFPRSEGRAVDAGCYLRYDSNPFFPSNATIDLKHFLPRGKEVNSTVWIIIGVVGGVFVLGLITCLLVFGKQIMGPSQIQVDTEGATELRGPGDFDFKILKKASNNFDEANKLGEGGFGQVFKGTLKNGNVVAIKKLTLGEHTKSLSWKERFNIILGTARGLAYLHDGFHVCIIHRDIKSSNILLDNNFQAKIADFGLARLLPHDKSHVSTKFAGTLGYTAPEYASHGQLTEKADTYSFGVVVLEIVSGRKSIDLNQPPDMQYLLEWVWSLHEENKVLEVVHKEEKMEGYDEEEVVRVINLALLCIQGSGSRRPSMSEAVTILLNKAEIDFQTPLQPAFVDVGYKVRGEYPLSESNAMITESLCSR
ncbi:hypothetical protein SUGI_1102790 [Cryptomeria japonica]|nr:hypothetical protein SUGI_1102790 [Cryptomeria japonica]